MNQQPTKQTAVGIDLGTTHSVLAYVDTAGRPRTIVNSQGHTLTPSAVFFDGDTVVVGRDAVQAAVIDPDAYAGCFKRDLGGPVYHRKVRGVDVPPEVLSAFVLQHLRQNAEIRLGRLRHAVITVPAFFDETRRRATQEAGRLAGLEGVDIVNEPTAAAVAFGYETGFFSPDGGYAGSRPIRVLVYDLGGGTFDVTILEIGPFGFRALATDGDVQLGGKDWDERLVDHLAGQFAVEHGIDPRSDLQDAAQLWLNAQELKHTLSVRPQATTMMSHAGVRMTTKVTRELFEELTRDLLERTETTTSLTIKAAGLTWSQIDTLLLVGGAVRMPMVPDILRRRMGKEPVRSTSPDELVAHGAALYATKLLRRDATVALARCGLQNINSHSLGIVAVDPRTRQRTNEIIIPRNTPIPCQVSRIFTTTKANQRNVKVAVTEGESSRPEECIALGDCVVRDLPLGLPKGIQVHVNYSYAANGRIAVTAHVPAARQSARVEIVHDGRSDLGDLETWRLRLCGHDPREMESCDLHDLKVNAIQSYVLHRLDALYTEVGKAAANEQLPGALARSQHSAQAAVAKWERARTVLRQAQRNKDGASGFEEAVRYGSELTRAKTALEHAQTEVDFAYQVLGRDCVAARYTPAQMVRAVAEIQRLNPYPRGS